ncbi:TetR/AcrR family transcriptional regulator [Rhizobium sp. C4]|uniref:TetR/AcrR family transcriptional regulator n=1 Tax=Rhizobium sp. C4 TaxID=1349800 RepID=UPI001E2D2AF3|nr:TetR/AcrR family transcriptional regulator [Rhizobium sp. C4]MCD2171947.1 TetR/AcrR family transcriptional regulator [Rhizobium sp. C4]
MPEASTHDHIVAAADDLFYRRGFDATSFADIAAAVSISRGNFYYHFKTKDEILDAVIHRRLGKTRAMLAAWEDDGADPKARIISFIEILIRNRADIMAHGCPVGTLCAELAKLDHAAKADAAKLFTLFREWLARQFTALGHAVEADSHAMYLLAMSQGVASLATAFRDEAFIRQEVSRMRDWLETLPTLETGVH